MAEEKSDTIMYKIKNNKFKQIISIDFGSFGSTAAFCLPQSAKIYIVKDWEGMKSLSSDIDNIMAKKTLTALLWDVNNKTVRAFGYQALKEYNDYKKWQNQINEGAESCYKAKTKMKKIFGDENIKLAYFEHFKPHLIGTDNLMKDTYIYPIDHNKNDRNAPKLSILDLITYSLIKIKEQSMKEAEKLRNDAQLDFKENEHLNEDEILWVLGTPAIWDDTSRGAFKKCAERAGMKYNEIGLEPEFALFCIKYYDQAKFMQIGKKYIVLDCGAGTIDATCVETQTNRLAEVRARTGNNFGSLMIDAEYYKLLDTIFGNDFMRKFKQQFCGAWNKIKMKFWTKKHTVKPDYKCWNTEIPNTFEKELKKKFENDDIKDYEDFDDEYVTDLCSKYSDRIRYEDGMLEIEMSVWQQFHEVLLKRICDFIKEILLDQNMTDCHDIILVGGLSNSRFLRQTLQNEFKNIHFHFANDVSWSVVIGGLYWAVDMDRRMWLTYGFEVDAEWNANTDDMSNKHRDINSSTGYVKKNVFDPIIFKNDLFKENERIYREYVIPITAGKLELNVYCVDSVNGVEYTTDEKCEIAACFELKLEDEDMVKAAQQPLPVTIQLEKTMIRIWVTMNGIQREMPITIRKRPEMLKIEGNEFIAQKKYKEAVAKYTQAIEYNPYNAVYFANRAAGYSYLRDYSQAVLDAQEAIKLDPNYIKAYVREGLAQFELGNYKEAHDAYQNALNKIDRKDGKWKFYKNKVEQCKLKM